MTKITAEMAPNSLAVAAEFDRLKADKNSTGIPGDVYFERLESLIGQIISLCASFEMTLRGTQPGE